MQQTGGLLNAHRTKRAHDHLRAGVGVLQNNRTELETQTGEGDHANDQSGRGTGRAHTQHANRTGTQGFDQTGLRK